MGCGATEVCASGSCQPAALVDLEGGPTSTCAIREQGRVVCWGYAIGLIPGDVSLVPVTPELPSAGVIVDFEIGHHTTAASYCAIVELPGGARDVYCWGQNNYAQLGDGSPKSRGTFGPTRLLAA
ncbi:MAG: hypothetical protein GWN73_00450, partial [Actinobacteria bacterium]|nr:hypothetical protein [Actinomycetota bacterium]NIU63989.1 hypothetical protein [Actinomycetota bacterium]NIV85410.1 hypothetical protein [Actinomycetota bacterium]NIW25787.1 hypothetical protein [Actinomycetota bacterium]